MGHGSAIEGRKRKGTSKGGVSRRAMVVDANEGIQFNRVDPPSRSIGCDPMAIGPHRSCWPSGADDEFEELREFLRLRALED